MLGVALDFENYPSTETPINSTNLNNMQKLLVDLIYPIGCYFETSDSEFDPNATWGGTWELDQSGTVLVSKSDASGSKFNASVGTTIGEEDHTLTIDEMPSHIHDFRANNSNTSGTISYPHFTGGYATQNTGSSLGIYPVLSAGENQPHNNVQPSKIINRWHRTA